MSADQITAGASSGGPTAWYERLPRALAPGYGGPSPDEAHTSDVELAAIVLRAAQLGIPAWRVVVALGMRLPPPSAE